MAWFHNGLNSWAAILGATIFSLSIASPLAAEVLHLKAGDRYQLEKINIFDEVIIENGASFEFDGRIEIVVDHFEYAGKKRPRFEVPQIDGKAIARNICASAPVAIIKARKITDYTTGGAFNPDSWTEMSYDEYRTCSNFSSVSRITAKTLIRHGHVVRDGKGESEAAPE